MTDAAEIRTCPVCGRAFRYYAGVWIIGRLEPVYCSKRCAFNDGTIVPSTEQLITTPTSTDMSDMSSAHQPDENTRITSHTPSMPAEEDDCG